VIESRLDSVSVGMLRLELALMAVQAGAGEKWLDNAVDAITAVTPDDLRLARVMLACLRLALGHEEAGAQALDEGTDRDDLTNEEWAVVASTARCLEIGPALRLLAWAAGRGATYRLLWQAGLGRLSRRTQASDSQGRTSTAEAESDPEELVVLAESVVSASGFRPFGHPDPESALRFRLGFDLRACGQRQAAIRLFRTGLTRESVTRVRDPGWLMTSHFALGICLAESEEPVEALQHLAIALAWMEQHPDGIEDALTTVHAMVKDLESQVGPASSPDRPPSPAQIPAPCPAGKRGSPPRSANRPRTMPSGQVPA
jgi:hypothetical protein